MGSSGSQGGCRSGRAKFFFPSEAFGRRRACGTYTTQRGLVFSLEGLSVAGGTCGFRKLSRPFFWECRRNNLKLLPFRDFVFKGGTCVSLPTESQRVPVLVLYWSCRVHEGLAMQPKIPALFFRIMWGALGRRRAAAERKSSFRGWLSVAGGTCGVYAAQRGRLFISWKDCRTQEEPAWFHETATLFFFESEWSVGATYGSLLGESSCSLP